VLAQEAVTHPDIESLLLVLTDGAGNVSVGVMPPQEEAYGFADQIADRHFRSVVINMEHASFDQGLAQALADHLKAPCYTLNELKAENLLQTVRQEINEGKNKPGQKKTFP
jgi:Mg-chelatase subunit ChlD